MPMPDPSQGHVWREIPASAAMTVCYNEGGKVVGIQNKAGDDIFKNGEDLNDPPAANKDFGYLIRKPSPNDPPICFWWFGKLY